MPMATGTADFSQAVEQYHRSIGEFIKGNPEPQKQIWSHRDDVSFANPLGPAVRGWEQVAAVLDRAASQIRDGEIVSVDNIVTYVTSELAFTVEVERSQVKVGGREDIVSVELRATTIFRNEDGAWKVIHRHADTVTSARPVESVIQT